MKGTLEEEQFLDWRLRPSLSFGLATAGHRVTSQGIVPVEESFVSPCSLSRDISLCDLNRGSILFGNNIAKRPVDKEMLYGSDATLGVAAALCCNKKAE